MRMNCVVPEQPLTRLWRFLYIAGAIFLGIVEAHACLCGEGKSSVAAGAAQAPIIFEGRVVATRVRLGGEHGKIFPIAVYDFAVLRRWKGASTSSITLVGGYDNCDTLFVGDATYLVYAGPRSRTSGQLSSSKCSPTKDASSAAADFALLGMPNVSYSTDVGSPRRRPNIIQAYAVGGVAAFANLLKQPAESESWRQIGTAATALLISGAIAGGAAVVVYRRTRRKIALALLGLVPFTLVGAILSAGRGIFRIPWFEQYLK